MNATPETRQQRRLRARREKRGALKEHPHPFRRALEMFKVRAAALKIIGKMLPLQAQLALVDLAMRVGIYKSRGKGRGTPSRRYGRGSANTPHQGEREMLRRRVGGLHWQRRRAMFGGTMNNAQVIAAIKIKTAYGWRTGVRYRNAEGMEFARSEQEFNARFIAAADSGISKSNT